jgi:hypothetical protein
MSFEIPSYGVNVADLRQEVKVVKNYARPHDSRILGSYSVPRIYVLLD